MSRERCFEVAYRRFCITPETRCFWSPPVVSGSMRVFSRTERTDSSTQRLWREACVVHVHVHVVRWDAFRMRISHLGKRRTLTLCTGVVWVWSLPCCPVLSHSNRENMFERISRTALNWATGLYEFGLFLSRHFSAFMRFRRDTGHRFDKSWVWWEVINGFRFHAINLLFFTNDNHRTEYRRVLEMSTIRHAYVACAHRYAMLMMMSAANDLAWNYEHKEHGSGLSFFCVRVLAGEFHRAWWLHKASWVWMSGPKKQKTTMTTTTNGSHDDTHLTGCIRRYIQCYMVCMVLAPGTQLVQGLLICIFCTMLPWPAQNAIWQRYYRMRCARDWWRVGRGAHVASFLYLRFCGGTAVRRSEMSI